MIDDPTYVTTLEPVRCLFTCVHEMHKSKKFPDSEPKYVLSFLIKKGDENHKKLEAAVLAAMGNKWHKAIQVSGNQNPFKGADGKVDGEKFAEEIGGSLDDYLVVRATSTRAPGLVDTAGRPIPLEVAKEKFQNGALVRVNVNAYAYDRGTKGVSFGLNHAQFVEAGKPVTSGGGQNITVEQAGFPTMGGQVAGDDDVDNIFG